MILESASEGRPVCFSVKTCFLDVSSGRNHIYIYIYIYSRVYSKSSAGCPCIIFITGVCSAKFCVCIYIYRGFRV